MSEKLRLERIKINNLFDSISYDIELHKDKNVSVLIAPNGCGKTTIFNIVNFICHPTKSNYQAIREIPFNYCECALSNGKSLVLSKPLNYLPMLIAQEKLEGVLDFDGKEYSFDIKDFLEKHTAEFQKPIMLHVFPSSQLMNLPDIKVMSHVFNSYMKVQKNDGNSVDRGIEKNIKVINVTLDKNTLELFDDKTQVLDDSSYIYLTDIFYNTNDFNEPRFNESFDYDTFTELLDAGLVSIEQLNVLEKMSYDGIKKAYETIYGFINDHDCLLGISYIRANRTSSDRLSKYSESPLRLIEKQARNFYAETMAAYNTIQQAMKDKLPKMFLLNKQKNEQPSFQHFLIRWETYVANIRKFYDVGLLPSGDAILDANELAEAFNKNSDFLLVYLDAFEKTLLPLERSYKRLNLFMSILNHRNKVTHKSFHFGKDGFYVIVNGKTLSLDFLSSGEKNDFIMFFYLIFSSEQNSLVLIDEPEISLHIQWQEEYLDYLLEICEMNDLHAIIATHSPNIVNGHYELILDKGLGDDAENC